MYISAIGSGYGANRARNNKQPNFKNLIKDYSAKKIIDKMSQEDRIEFEQIEKKLSKTKFWDMKISSVGKKFQEFSFEFIDKLNKRGVITGGIYPYNKEANTISVYTIIYGPENISRNTLETLKFKSKERADEIYEEYIENARYIINRSFNVSPLERLKSKVVELNMLEEAAQVEGSSKNLTTVSTEFVTKNNVGNDLYKKYVL